MVKRYADGLVPEDARLYLDHCTLLHCSKINGNEDLEQKLDFWIQNNHENSILMLQLSVDRTRQWHL